MICLIILAGFALIFGLFLSREIISYLKNKAIGQQTLLDGIYIQLLEYMALFSITIVKDQILYIIFESFPMPIALFFGWSTYTVGLVFIIHLTFSAIIRFLIGMYLGHP